MVVSPFDVRRAAGLAMICAAAALAGCDAATQSIAQSMSESEHRAEYARLEAQGTPRFSDPKLQGFVREFEAEYARYGRDGEKLKADAVGPAPWNRSGPMACWSAAIPTSWSRPTPSRASA